MPFLIGPRPLRRSLNYLKAGKVFLRETVKIFAVHYNRELENHKGIRDFVFWHLDQIQYKNPGVQCLVLEDLTPSPFIRVYFENAKDIIINVNCRPKNDILDHLVNFTAICQSEKEICDKQKSQVPYSLFGYGCKRHCICEVMGQVPCPTIVKLPNSWRKFRNHNHKIFNVPYYYTEKGLDEIEE